MSGTFRYSICDPLAHSLYSVAERGGVGGVGRGHLPLEKLMEVMRPPLFRKVMSHTLAVRSLRLASSTEAHVDPAPRSQVEHLLSEKGYFHVANEETVPRGVKSLASLLRS